MAEQTFFRNQDVHVTNTRAVFGSRTYSMANVTSVAMMVRTPNRIPAVILIVLGIVMIAGRGIAMGVLLIGFGFVLMLKKPEYFVQINSSSGEVNARSSKDQRYIQEIVDAMNAAIVWRG